MGENTPRPKTVGDPAEVTIAVLEKIESMCDERGDGEVDREFRRQMEETGRQIAETILWTSSIFDYDEESVKQIETYLSTLSKKRKTEKRSMERTLGDFKDNPEACNRFKAFYETSELCRGKSGRPTIDALAALLRVRHSTAKNYIENPARMTVLACSNLKRAVGHAAYFDMLHGEGAHARLVATNDAREARIELESYLNSLDPERMAAEIRFFFATRDIFKARGIEFK